MRNRLTRFLWTLLAAIFLVEAWLWDVVGGLVATVVSVLPIPSLRRGLRRMIDTLPAGFALALFIVPILLILPFKLVGLALIAKGRVFAGAFVFVLAKTVGLGVTAFIFDVCHERLMTLAWFSRLYSQVIVFRDWAHYQLEPYRIALRASVARLRARIAERLSSGAPSIMGQLATLREQVRARLRSPIKPI